MDRFSYFDEFVDWLRKINNRHNIYKKLLAGVSGIVTVIVGIIVLCLVILYPWILVIAILLGVAFLIARAVYEKIC